MNPHPDDLATLDCTWSELMAEYWGEGSCPYRWFERQRLLVINLSFLVQVWPCEIRLSDLPEVALRVARVWYPEAKRVRVSFGEDWGEG